MTQVTHSVSDSEKVRMLLSVSKNTIALAERLGCDSPHPIYHAAKQPKTFAFQKESLRIAVDALYHELTGTQPFEKPVQSRLDELKGAYTEALDDDPAVSGRGLKRVKELVSDVWTFLNIGQGDFSKSDDVSGLAYLSGTICFIVLILMQKFDDFRLEIAGFPTSKKALAKRGESDLDQALNAVEMPDHAVRIAVTRVALCQKRMTLSGYAKADLSDALPDKAQRAKLLAQLMRLVALPLPQVPALLNAVKVASNLRQKDDCLNAARKLVEKDSRFLDPDYKGWTILASPEEDPDLEFYRASIAPKLYKGDEQ